MNRKITVPDYNYGILGGTKKPDKLPPKGKFDREKIGNYELIFPFNRRSEELAFAMNRQVSSAASMGAPNYLKMMI